MSEYRGLGVPTSAKILSAEGLVRLNYFPEKVYSVGEPRGEPVQDSQFPLSRLVVERDLHGSYQDHT